jgi:hypothetical protein
LNAAPQAGCGIISVVWPGLLMLMTPAQLHISFDVLFSAGMFDTSTVGAPGAQGAAITGMQCIGVSTPRAAAVAAATCGFARLMQTPNGGMFIIGTLSMMLPASMLPVFTIFGVALKVDGAAPNVHIIIAPVQTCMAMA